MKTTRMLSPEEAEQFFAQLRRVVENAPKSEPRAPFSLPSSHYTFHRAEKPVRKSARVDRSDGDQIGWMTEWEEREEQRNTRFKFKM
ncbi:MAG: hypothetical protein WCV79_01190 [Candidatus Paceibacterota bacterium]